jgi:hypothetical protein
MGLSEIAESAWKEHGSCLKTDPDPTESGSGLILGNFDGQALMHPEI